MSNSFSAIRGAVKDCGASQKGATILHAVPFVSNDTGEGSIINQSARVCQVLQLARPEGNDATG